jgi:acyl homoserine lactone synthase
MNEMSKAVVDEGATHVIGIVPSVFRRWLQRLGMGAFPVGPKVMFDSDISQAAVMHVAALGSRASQ